MRGVDDLITWKEKTTAEQLKQFIRPCSALNAGGLQPKMAGDRGFQGFLRAVRINL